MSHNEKRPYDLVVYGATGFTGKLVAKYLKQAAGSTQWAIAGRSFKKLDAVKRDLGLQVDILEADSFDVTALLKLVKQTKAIISLVGPYEIYGSALYKACAENGTHYFDLTGEIPFCIKMIGEHSAAAIKSGAIMIHSCGWDSIPSDLGTFLAVQELQKAKPNAKVGLVETAHKFKGAFSGGTFASMISMIETERDLDRKTIGSPFVISPISAPNRKYKHAYGTPFAANLQNGKRGGFFVMAFHNTKIVYRTFGILETLTKANKEQFHYGEDFHYNEYVEHSSAFRSTLVSVTLLFFLSLLTLKPIRALVKRFGPQSGDGPSEQARTNGYWKATTIASEVDGSTQATVTAYGKGDPGYASTAMMISECALAVLQDREKLPAIAKDAGPLTPATALGNVLRERLERTGFFSWEASISQKGARQATPLNGKAKL